VTGLDAMIPADVPRDMPIEVREAVRVVVLDADDRILLFRAKHVVYPELGCWWELPGGGTEPGESHAETAMRELLEETGIRVRPDQISPANWRRIATFKGRVGRRVQHEVVVTARIDGTAVVDISGQHDYELEDYTTSRWWSVADVRASTERFYPGRLPEFIDAHLRGDEIDEPFELWS
jgi:8-oxo-dGTP pyrophosphatase MutT (NUDIX family)